MATPGKRLTPRVTVAVMAAVMVLGVAAAALMLLPGELERRVQEPEPLPTVTVTINAPMPASVHPTSPAPKPSSQPTSSTTLQRQDAVAQPTTNKFTPNVEQFEKDAVQVLTNQPNATFGMFVQDLDTGARLEHNADRRLAGGSLVNVDMAAELMAISTPQNSDAAKVRAVVGGMLRTEDPKSTQLTYTHIGGADGLANAATRFGTTSTVPGRDGSWAGNKTTARDRVKILRVLIDKNPALNPVDQKFIVDALAASTNEPGWGVRRAGVAASKNSTMSDQWVTNTFGLVTTADNRRLVVCILSAGWNNQADGRTAVDSLLRAALTNLGAPAG